MAIGNSLFLLVDRIKNRFLLVLFIYYLSHYMCDAQRFLQTP
jgi:hypothetical protein